MSILVGDVGSHLGAATAEALVRRGQAVVGFAEPKTAGDPGLRRVRLGHLALLQGFGFMAGGLEAAAPPPDLAAVVQLVDAASPRTLATTASWLECQLALLDLCIARRPLPHLVQAVIRAEPGRPVPEETLAQAFARLHGLPVTSLRLAEVYGPAGDPGQLCQRFAAALVAGRPVLVPPAARVIRPLWIEDAVAAILAALDHPPTERPPFRRRRLAGPEPVSLRRLADLVAAALGVEAPTCLDADGSQAPPGEDEPAGHGPDALPGWQPMVGLDEGLARFAAWCRSHA